MNFINQDELRSKELLSGVNARTFWGDNMLGSIVDIDAHAAVPDHTHPHEQLGIVIEGTMQMTIENQTRTLSPGDVYLIPGNVPHSAIAGDHAVKVIDVFSPVREEYKF